MKATIKLCNPNACGASPIEEYATIKELKNYLNHCLYYSGEVYLNVPSENEPVKYSETNDVASLVSSVNYYGDEYLEVIPTFETCD